MERYLKPNMEIVEFDVEDIIETSNGENENNGVASGGDDPFEEAP